MASDFEARMTFTEHLGELRNRIMRAGMAVGAAFIVCFIISEPLLNFITGPLRDRNALVEMALNFGVDVPEEVVEEVATKEEGKKDASVAFITLTPLEPFFVRMKVAAYVGLLIAFPYVLYQICAFVFPGLKPSERNIAKFLIVGCGILASLGFVVAYYGVFPLVLPYLMQYNPQWVTTQLQLDPTVSLLVKALLGFAVAFQFPMAVLILVYLGVLHPAGLKQYRKIIFIGLAFLSAFFTPPDPLSMLLLLVPLYLLYEMSILLSYIVIRLKKDPGSAGEG